MPATLPYKAQAAHAAVVDTALAEEAALLIIAARENDTAQIRSLLEDGMHINATDAQGMTALHWAIKHRNVAAATALIADGADSEIEDRSGWTPMALAIKGGSPTIIEIAMRGLDRHLVKQ